MEQVAMALNDEQKAAAQHIKKDFKKKAPGAPKGANKKTPEQKKAKAKQLALKVKEKAKAVPKTDKKQKAGTRMCATCKKAPPRSARALRCHPCQKKVRTAQLARNNVAWRKRIEQGKAKHHATYAGKPTIWAATHPKQALEYAKKHGVLPVEKVKASLDKFGKRIAAQVLA